MKCPVCGGKTAVKDVAKADSNIYRRRACLNCGHKMYTTEKEVAHNAEYYEAVTSCHRSYRYKKNVEE